MMIIIYVLPGGCQKEIKNKIPPWHDCGQWGQI